jgi:hypothetical protein
MPLFGAFPKYRAHKDARCFRCGGRLIEEALGQFPTGRGNYHGYCPECEMRTWYDIEEPKTA